MPSARLRLTSRRANKSSDGWRWRGGFRRDANRAFIFQHSEHPQVHSDVHESGTPVVELTIILLQ